MHCLQTTLLLAGLARPYRDLVLAAQGNDAHKVAATILGPRGKPVLYAKHIAKHKVGLDQALWQGATHMVRFGTVWCLQCQLSSWMQLYCLTANTWDG